MAIGRRTSPGARLSITHTGEYPKVKAGEDVDGYATAHTPTAVISPFRTTRVRSEWFPPAWSPCRDEDPAIDYDAPACGPPCDLGASDAFAS